MSNLWEVNNGDDRFLACVDCAYKHVADLFEKGLVTPKPLLNENWASDDGNHSAAEDFFNEHTITVCGVAHKCSGCNLEIGN